MEGSEEERMEAPGRCFGVLVGGVEGEGEALGEGWISWLETVGLGSGCLDMVAGLVVVVVMMMMDVIGGVDLLVGTGE